LFSLALNTSRMEGEASLRMLTLQPPYHDTVVYSVTLLPRLPPEVEELLMFVGPSLNSYSSLYQRWLLNIRQSVYIA
jgi:hypothetical protein